MSVVPAGPELERWEWSAAVIGLGYVGLPLVVTLARSGIGVHGFDENAGLIGQLAAGHSHVDDVTDDDLAELADRLDFSSNRATLAEADVIFICVPTPLSQSKQPDLSYIERAVDSIASVLRPGHVVILESTTYPGTTEDVVLPRLSATGLLLDRDFFLAYSPERMDPGNSAYQTSSIPRIVGGVTPRSTEVAVAAYRRIVDKIHPVSSARVAEAAKLLENTFRWVNIALVNEMSFIARAINVDIGEIIDAAATKPFGFMPFYPGPGVGGHCIPLDPFYLQWAARVGGEGTRFIELADAVNARMPAVVADRVADALNDQGKAVRGAKILVLGVAYKAGISDSRQSPALVAMRNLLDRGAVIEFSDPLVSEVDEQGMRLSAVEMTRDRLSRSDCVVILCDHPQFDYRMVASQAACVVDTRLALRRRGLTSRCTHTL